VNARAVTATQLGRRSKLHETDRQDGRRRRIIRVLEQSEYRVWWLSSSPLRRASWCRP